MAGGTTGTNASTVTKFKPGAIGADSFILERDIRETITPYYDYGSIMDFFGVAGGRNGLKKMAAKQNELNHYEEDQVFTVAVLNAAASGGASAGATATCVMVGVGSGSTWVQPFRLNDIVSVGSTTNGRVLAQVTSITVDNSAGEHTFVLKPLKAAEQLNPATVANAGEEIRFVTHGTADGGKAPDSMQSKLIRLTQYMQMYKEKSGRYGGESANQSVVKIDGAPYLAPRNLAEALQRLHVQVTNAALFGEAQTNSITDVNHPDGSGESVTYQIGLEEFITSNSGINYDYAAAFDNDDFVALDKALYERHSANEYMFRVGHNLMHGIDASMFTKIKDATAFGFFDSDPVEGRKMAAAMNFKTVMVGNRTFHIRSEKTLSAPDLIGPEYLDYGYLIPNSVYKTGGTYRDMLSGKTQEYNSIALRYREYPKDGSRMMKLIERTPKEIGADQYETHIYAEWGIQFAGIRQFGRAYT